MSHQNGPERTEPVREVTIFKGAEAVLGMTLAKPTIDGLTTDGEGVLVVRLLPGGIIAKTKRIAPGDLILAVNGVKCRNYSQAAQLLREAQGVLQLVITSTGPLPDGWQATTDKKGTTLFRNAALGVITHDHPLTAEGEAEPEAEPECLASPKKMRTARDRWHTAYHTVSMVNSLAGETEREDRGRSSDDDLDALHTKVLQRERV